MYDLYFAQNVSLATDSFQRALSLAVSTGNTRAQSIALYHIAWINWQLGDYSTAQRYAQESQWQARISADLLNEAKALSVEAQTWTELGGYKQSMSLYNMARGCLARCGMSGGSIDHGFMIGLAAVHLNKSEYAEAGSIYTQILEEVSMEQDPYRHALALFNLAEIHVQIDVPQDDVQRAIDVAKSMFNTIGDQRLEIGCDIVQAQLHLREQDFQRAKAILQDSIRISWGKHSDNVVDCLKELGDIGRWGATEGMSSWTIMLLIYSLKLKQNLGICKALQFLGVAFLTWGDEDTAMSLFSVALDGFTGLDVHRSRGECMVQIGDIYKRYGHSVKAVECWQTARPLLEKSSQVKQVEHIVERLAGV
jgi:tetratricopeptide (TPR) repeat protein